MGWNICAEVLSLPRGISISLYGGDAPHIGAVAVLSPEGEIILSQFSGHKEGEICQAWALSLKQRGIMPAVIHAGIHYDQLSKAGIQQVLQTSDQLLNEVLASL